MMKKLDEMGQDGVDMTPFLKLGGGSDQARQDEGDSRLRGVLRVLKLSALALGITVGVAFESLSWATHIAILIASEHHVSNIWIDVVSTAFFLFFLPALFMEVIYAMFKSIIELISSRIEEDLLHQLYSHVQSRMAVGFLCGVLVALSFLDICLRLKHHFVYNGLVIFLLIAWCLVEKLVLNEKRMLHLLFLRRQCNNKSLMDPAEEC